MKASLPQKLIVLAITGLTSGLLMAIFWNRLVEVPPKTPGPIPVKDEAPESSPRQDYVGEVKNGLYHGQSTLTFDAEDKYVGQFEDGMYHGE